MHNVPFLLLLPFPVKAPTSTALYMAGVKVHHASAVRRLLAAEQTHLLSVKAFLHLAELERLSVYWISSLTTG